MRAFDKVDLLKDVPTVMCDPLINGVLATSPRCALKLKELGQRTSLEGSLWASIGVVLYKGCHRLGLSWLRGKIREVLRNWPEKNIQVIVVTDGERILGLGDLGCQCLPITIDVGTNNEQLLNDELYIGLKQRRATGQEYAKLMHEFMTALKQTYGEKVLIQFEDFANHNAFDLLEKYSPDIVSTVFYGTTSVVLAGLVAALKLVGGNLTDHRFLFLGAGEAGTGITELIALETSKQTNAPLEEVHKNIWLVDSKVV
ncbi:hypothetical protein LR48_Vigan10g115900 [Vigna angularis]|uniref:Malic enzyme N-terminal domain-containing protein n=1 Tax=Phaseolus angularis TaxID=3914 RepID=A0A0L9VK28_PHAAN|nr:hypothetical protein LR48_Vigan10g115900 [Vigna angularis]